MINAFNERIFIKFLLMYISKIILNFFDVYLMIIKIYNLALKITNIECLLYHEIDNFELR